MKNKQRVTHLKRILLPACALIAAFAIAGVTLTVNYSRKVIELSVQTKDGHSLNLGSVRGRIRSTAPCIDAVIYEPDAFFEKLKNNEAYRENFCFDSKDGFETHYLVSDGHAYVLRKKGIHVLFEAMETHNFHYPYGYFISDIFPEGWRRAGWYNSLEWQADGVTLDELKQLYSLLSGDFYEIREDCIIVKLQTDGRSPGPNEVQGNCLILREDANSGLITAEHITEYD